MIIKKNTLTLCIGLVTASRAFAEEVYTFDDVVVSATRSEQSKEDVSASIALVGGAQLEEKMAQNLEQAVEGLPGVSVQGTGRYGSSGFNIRGLNENYVKTLVDGVELPASYNPGADVMRKFNNHIETDTLERIEINKGPSSSLYGSDALAGAVIIRTKKPDDLLNKEEEDTYASLKGGYYSADKSYKATATLANRIGAWESLLIFTHRYGHETRTHSSGLDTEGRDRGQADPFDIGSDNLLAKAFYQINPQHQLGVTAEVFNRDANGLILSNEGHQIGPNNIYTRNSAKDQDKRKRLTLEHEWKADVSAFDTAHSQLTGMTTESLHNTFDETPLNGYRQRERQGTDNSVQFDIQLNKAIDFDNSYHEISYGVSGVNNAFELGYRDLFLEGPKQGMIENKSGEVPNASALKWGLFLQDQAFFLEERLIVNAGIRYDRFHAKPENTSTTTENKESSSQALTGRLGAVYHWNENISTYSNISQGFKSPSLQDLYFFYETDAAFGALFEPNPHLKPEQSIGYETGMRFHYDAARLDFAVYLNDYTDFIESYKFSENAPSGKERWTKQNINKAQIYGAELNMTLALDSLLSAPSGLYSEFNLAYAKGEDKENKKALDTVAPLSAKMALGYQPTERPFGANLSIKAVAGKKGDDWSNANGVSNVTAPGYVVTDLTGFYRPIKDLTLRAGLFNIFDTQYWDYSDLSNTQNNALGLERRTQSGRNWGLEAEYVF